MADVGPVTEPALVELSGLVASRAHPGVLYAHNDSGDTARFFAISTSGAPLGEFTLDGGSAHDWEDIGLGPCPTGTCVFLGDIGDNNTVRTDYAVYRVPEPAVAADAGVGVTPVTWERLPYAYPGGAKHNCESLFVHPVTGRIYLITKELGGNPSHVYRFPEPLTPGVEATLVDVAPLTVPTASDNALTAADVNPCGTAVLLRMYNRMVELRLPDGADFETIFAQTPIEVPHANEPQGESVAYSFDGRAYFSSTEKLTATVPLDRSVCK
jgi:hypothetical protein